MKRIADIRCRLHISVESRIQRSHVVRSSKRVRQSQGNSPPPSSHIIPNIILLQSSGEITMETVDESFVLRVLTRPDDLLSVSTRCFCKTRFLEQSKVSKVQAIWQVMHSVAFQSYAEAAAVITQENGVCRFRPFASTLVNYTNNSL